MDNKNVAKLWFCGVLSLAVYALLRTLSFQFVPSVPQLDRPLFTMIGLFGIAFVLYLFGQWTVLRIDVQHGRFVASTVIAFAIGFRLLLIGSEPIQEVDIYRYLWDGMVSHAGVSPFSYPPLTVTQCGPEQTDDLPEDLAALVRLRDFSVDNREVLHRVHYPSLPTVYPPVSQRVFAISAWLTHESATLRTRVWVMKCLIVLFDLGTILCIVGTLRLVGGHPGWVLSYAWCPLVMKEFANSGHLDAIAVFLTASAVYCCLLAFYGKTHSAQLRLRWLIASAVLLGLGVGAKLYPVALVPILAITTWQRAGAIKTLIVAAVFTLVTAWVLRPLLHTVPVMSPTESLASGVPSTQVGDRAFGTGPETENSQMPSGESGLEVLDSEGNGNSFIDGENPFENLEPTDEITLVPSSDFGMVSQDRQAGLKAFLSRWMMNDLIFLNCIENLTPDDLRSENPIPWFVLVPNHVRDWIVEGTASRWNIEAASVPFLLARALTGGMFAVLALFWAVQASKSNSASRWVELVFLTMAWFWMLLPTLNPWYWIWALPWIAFAKNRVWLLLSGCLFIYYLRFYFEASVGLQWGGIHGEYLFHYVVVWFEYVPWFIALIAWKVFLSGKNVVAATG